MRCIIPWNQNACFVGACRIVLCSFSVVSVVHIVVLRVLRQCHSVHRLCGDHLIDKSNIHRVTNLWLLESSHIWLCDWLTTTMKKIAGLEPWNSIKTDNRHIHIMCIFPKDTVLNTNTLYPISTIHHSHSCVLFSVNEHIEADCEY